MAKPDPCGIRYGLWRARALALASTEEVYGGVLQRALDDAGIHVVVGTLHPALDQMVSEGLLERVAGKRKAGVPRLLRITPRGLEVLRDVRGDAASVLDLIDESLGRDPTSPDDAAERLVAIAQEIQRATARLRRALDQAKAIVDGALSQAAEARRARDA